MIEFHALSVGGPECLRLRDRNRERSRLRQKERERESDIDSHINLVEKNETATLPYSSPTMSAPGFVSSKY